MIASANDVQLQVVGNHPPSTQFKLMMGAIDSKRDRLSAAYQVNSLFIMDFAPGGTNKPHRHKSEEEIYFVLKGKGEMVAGGTPEKENRLMAKEGDAFFFPANTLVGFYSDSTQCTEHALILAVRSKLPK
jgi:quercetin dioxygenase-like cupin family protein